MGPRRVATDTRAADCGCRESTGGAREAGRRRPGLGCPAPACRTGACRDARRPCPVCQNLPRRGRAEPGGAGRGSRAQAPPGPGARTRARPLPHASRGGAAGAARGRKRRQACPHSRRVIPAALVRRLRMRARACPRRGRPCTSCRARSADRTACGRGASRRRPPPPRRPARPRAPGRPCGAGDGREGRPSTCAASAPAPPRRGPQGGRLPAPALPDCPALRSLAAAAVWPAQFDPPSMPVDTAKKMRRARNAA